MLELGPPTSEELGPPGEQGGGGSPGIPSLSGPFDPFLGRFARMATEVGGRVLVARDAGRAVALLLTDPEDRTASLFTRSPDAARALWAETSGWATFAEVALPLPREEFIVYAARLDAAPQHRFRHRVRLLDPGDTEAVAELLHEVYGGAHLRWLGIARGAGEVGFVTEVEGRLVGVAWVLVVGGHARLHGLTVRPGFRRLGLGTDLLSARLLFAAREGARQVVSEIAVGNAPSRAIAERAGMRDAGRIYLYLPSPPAVGPPGPELRLVPGSTSA